MSDENTTPRRVTPEGSVPDDREPYAGSDREPDAVPEREPELAATSQPAAEPDVEPVSEEAREPGAGLSPEPEPGRDAGLDAGRDAGADTLLIEQDRATTELPSAAPVATPPAAPVFPAGAMAGPVPAPQPGGLVTVRTGPRPGAILLGLICLLVSAYTFARQMTDWRFDLSLAGPITIGALGTLLLLVGLVGLLARRKP